MKHYTSQFIQSNLKHGSPEWHQARKNAIGASEVGSIMGLSPFTPAVKTFYEKLGLMPSEEANNNFIYWGHALEDLIVKAWECHDGEELSYMKGQVQRHALPCPGHYITKEYPFIASTPDRTFSDFKFVLEENGALTKQNISTHCPLEVKTISGYAVSMWEGGIPVYYLAQIHAQMLCMDTDYAELAMLKDGRELIVYPVNRSEELINLIIEKSTEFWGKVTEAREILKQGETEEAMKAIQQIEPAIENTPAYMDFLSKKYSIDTDKKRIATDEEIQGMKSYLRARELSKQGEDAMQDMRIKLLKSAEDYSEIGNEEYCMINRPADESKGRKRAYFIIKKLK